MTTHDPNGDHSVVSRRLAVVFGGLVSGLVLVVLVLAPELQARLTQDGSGGRPFNSGVGGIASPFGMGKMAPNFTLLTLDGGKVTLSELP